MVARTGTAVNRLPALAGRMAACSLALLVGCTGSGRVQVTSLSARFIDPPPAKINHFEPNRCWWWLDEHGRLCLAMEQDRPSLLGNVGSSTFRMSLVLQDPPAGPGRNYPGDAQTMRASYHRGGSSHRFQSYRGIVAVRARPNHIYEGTFRLWAMHRGSGLLAGWGAAAPYLFLGRFQAVRNQQAGRDILIETEYGIWARRRPASQPATQPN